MLSIIIPDDIDRQLSMFTNNKREFILTAIRQKIAFLEKALSPEQLAKEYADSVEENKEILKDFVDTDKENWNDY